VGDLSHTPPGHTRRAQAEFSIALADPTISSCAYSPRSVPEKASSLAFLTGFHGLCYLAAMQPMTRADELEFRFATSADLTDTIALVESAYRGDASRAGWTTEADLLDGQRTDAEEVAGILEDTDARLLLVTHRREVVGCVMLRREAGGAYIGMLAVRPSLQALGIGKRLLAEAEEKAGIVFGAKRSRMTVIEQRQDLIAWYVRRGYLVTTRTEPFPYGNPRFGLPRRPDLRFVVLEKVLAR